MQTVSINSHSLDIAGREAVELTMPSHSLGMSHSAPTRREKSRCTKSL